LVFIFILLVTSDEEIMRFGFLRLYHTI